DLERMGRRHRPFAVDLALRAVGRAALRRGAWHPQGVSDRRRRTGGESVAGKPRARLDLDWRAGQRRSSPGAAFTMALGPLTLANRRQTNGRQPHDATDGSLAIQCGWCEPFRFDMNRTC